MPPDTVGQIAAPQRSLSSLSNHHLSQGCRPPVVVGSHSTRIRYYLRSYDQHGNARRQCSKATRRDALLTFCSNRHLEVVPQTEL
jgi:hypothetical protein